MLPALTNAVTMPWKLAAHRGSAAADDSDSDSDALKKPATAKRTRTASSQMDLDLLDAHAFSDDLTETESALSASSPSSPIAAAHAHQQRTLHLASFDPYERYTPPSSNAPLRATMFSFARAGLHNSKMLFSKAKKPHSRSVSDFSESDFAPFTPGTIVSTKFGLGTVQQVRDDGITAVQLQSRPPMMLYTAGEDDEYYAVPALVGDWVQTPAGEGYVLGYDAFDQMYAVRVGDDVAAYECRVRQSDVQKYVRPRRNSMGSAPSSALQKGLSSALKTIVSTSSGISQSTYAFVSNKYYHGQCVVTTFGAGCITALDPVQKTVQVQLTSGATAYLSADMIKHYPKALVGMDVTTKFGNGRVEALRPDDAIYTVRLHEAKLGESDVVYVHESDLTRTRRLTTAVENVHKQVRGRLMAFAQKRFAAARGSASGADLHPEEEIHTAGI